MHSHADVTDIIFKVQLLLVIQKCLAKQAPF